MKLALIGNSHIGALKRGWDGLAGQHPDTTITFFGARGPALQHLHPKGDRLVPATAKLSASLRVTANGSDTIRPADFDAILLYGIRAQAPFAAPDGTCSRAAQHRALADQSFGEIHFRLLERIRQLSAIPVHLGHMPLPAAPRGDGPQEPQAYLDGIAAINAALYTPRGATMIAQPTQTIVNGINTDPAFTEGSRRLVIDANAQATAHAADDTRHMNDAFGEVWLTQYLAQIKSLILT